MRQRLTQQRTTQRARPRLDGFSRSASRRADLDGSYMSVGNLAAIRKKVTDLATMIHNDTPLEDWVESKIQSAADDISDIYDYLMYSNR